MPEPGQRSPELSATTDDGSVIGPADLRGRWLVLYFYPKDATTGCTREATDFRDLLADFVAAGARVIGVSRDSVASHARFVAKQQLPFRLIADVDEAWCRAFDVIGEKKLYGRPYVGVIRSTFLIDPDGVIAAAWRNVKVPGHAQAVLERLRSS